MTDIRTALVQARQTAQILDGAKAANVRLLTTLEGVVEAPFNDTSLAARHRAEHRMGVPSRLNTDTELQAFVLDRIERMTYKQVVAEVAKTFPPDRQTSISAVQRWWRKRAPQSPKARRS
ncbi:hypothetical protein [Pseudorhodobacter ferrugineus]|uniref:hypothetical protein n=1 Tax=Pseudorhodobacter ferrugineus TaxID=77008 RepID=UPI0003B3E1E5|nr:hypothetical protein [Pseudorhodobacter ferrugineus]